MSAFLGPSPDLLLAVFLHRLADRLADRPYAGIQLGKTGVHLGKTGVHVVAHRLDVLGGGDAKDLGEHPEDAPFRQQLVSGRHCEQSFVVRPHVVDTHLAAQDHRLWTSRCLVQTGKRQSERGRNPSVFEYGLGRDSRRWSLA
eukprot:scaffold12085_cov54-Phaeocystis_antarctica.AAC.4